MHPTQLLAIKERVLKTDLAQTRTLAQRVLRSDDPGRIRDLIAKLNG